MNLFSSESKAMTTSCSHCGLVFVRRCFDLFVAYYGMQSKDICVNMGGQREGEMPSPKFSTRYFESG